MLLQTDPIIVVEKPAILSLGAPVKTGIALLTEVRVTIRGMRLNAEHRLNAGPSTVLAVLTNESFLDQVARDMNAQPQLIDVTADATGRVTSRLQAVVAAPPELQHLLGPELTIDYRVTWDVPAADGATTGQLDLDVVRTPARATGTALLRGHDDHTVVSYVGTITVQVPLIGSQLARQAAPMIEDAFDAQLRVAQRFLAQT